MAHLPKVGIIGGGIAGLAAAVALKSAAQVDHPCDWMLLEKDHRLGGKILTEQHDGFVIDGGPDCYLAEKPWVAQMARRLGIADQLLPSDDSQKRTFIYARGCLQLLPEGVMMMVPTKFLPFATTSLFTLRGKARMALDLVIPKRKGGGDESLASFVRRRLGRECLDLLAEPMVGGVHAADPERLSLKAAFPRFLQMEQRYGSLIRGFLAARRAAAGVQKASGTHTYFMTLKSGMQQLTDAMAAEAENKLLRGREVLAVERDGGDYVLRLTDGSTEHCGALIVAAEAYQAARMLRDLDAELAALLDGIQWTSAATVSLAYPMETLGHALRGFGFLVPIVSGRKIMAVTWSSTKWQGRAPQGYGLIRAFVGGPHSGFLIDLDDESMMAMVREELRVTMGITASPELVRIYRWPKGMPQYNLGHLDRLAAIERRLAAHPGLSLCGASYRGIGTGDCINSGEQAAAQAATFVRASRS